MDDSPPARRLFVAMLERSPQLLLSFGSPEFQDAFDRKMSEWSTSASPWQRKISPDGSEELDGAAAGRVPAGGRSQSDAGSAHQSIGRVFLVPEPGERQRTKGCVRSILGVWILQTGRQPAEARLHLAQHYRFSEGIVPAREIIDSEANGLEIQNAILFLAIFGQDQDIPPRAAAQQRD